MDVGPIRNFWSNMTYSPITYLLQLNGLTIQNCSGISHTATTLGTASSVSNILFNNANISTVYANRTVSFFVRNPFLAASGQLQVKMFISRLQFRLESASYILSTTLMSM
jgi:hypothetical protein